MKLLLHKLFLSNDDFDSYMETHGNDYEAAYEHFARHDPDAPSHVKDDFRELHIETDDRERLQPDELNPSEKVEFRSEYSFYRFMGKQELAEALERSLPLFGDWAARTKQRYSPEQVKDTDCWMQHAKALPSSSTDAAASVVPRLDMWHRRVWEDVSDCCYEVAAWRPLPRMCTDGCRC